MSGNNEILYLLNKREVSAAALSEAVQAAISPDRLTLAGGFLVKCHLGPGVFHLGMLPVMDGGLRNRHYDIPISGDPLYTLTGFFNTDRSLGLIFVPPAKGASGFEFLNGIRGQYRGCVRVLVDAGLPPDWDLDWITRQILCEAALFHEGVSTVENLLDSGSTRI